MAVTLVRRGSGTPTTTSSNVAWTNPANAVDGTPPANPATYAVWNNSAANATGTITVSGYDFTAIGGLDTLDSVTVTFRHTVNAAARFLPGAFQAYNGATPLGSPVAFTPNSPAHNETSVFAVTKTQLQSAGFGVRVSFQKIATVVAATFSLDHIDVTAVYTPPGGKPKVWTGSAWVEKPAKVWSGSAWVEKPMKVWTGSTWDLV